jgi:hypothetical protein
MTDELDRAPDKVLAAANKVHESVGRLWQLSFASGVREGMEVAAQGIEAAITSIDSADMPQVFEDVLRDVLGSLRDRIRTEALGIEDPEPVVFGQTEDEGGEDA